MPAGASGPASPVPMAALAAGADWSHREPYPFPGGEMRQSIGIVGTLALLTLMVWAIGWLFLGWHTGFFHALVPVAIVLSLIQVTRRVSAG